MSDILDDLRDLHKQATQEKSHHYTGKCIERAIAEIVSLRGRPMQLPPPGCICPGDATPLCASQFCPRKPVPSVRIMGAAHAP